MYWLVPRSPHIFRSSAVFHREASLVHFFFNIFINDITDSFDNKIAAKLFADDIKLYTEITTSDSIFNFQNHLDKISSWSILWQLTILYSKCNLLELGRHNLCQLFHIASNSLNYNQSTRDLGVIIDTNLKFQEHINLIMKQANQRANLIHRYFLSKDSLNLTRGFKIYVRPLLEYDSSVWTPHNKNLIESIEAVQRSFTKRIPGCQKLSYGERLAKLNLQSLEHRRLLTDLLTCYNIVHGFTSLTFDNFFHICCKSVQHTWSRSKTHHPTR